SLSTAAALSVDDDDRGAAGGAQQPLERRRGVLFSVRLGLHRAPHARPRASASVHHDGNGDLAEPAARVQEGGRADRGDQWPQLVAIVSALPVYPPLFP